MNNIVYLKEPGILYDMISALTLRFNGERVYLPMRTGTITYEEDEQYYTLIIDKLAGISEKLFPLFYYDRDKKLKTAISVYLHEYINLTVDGLFDYFYESLHNVERLKKVIYTNYIIFEVLLQHERRINRA